MENAPPMSLKPHQSWQSSLAILLFLVGQAVWAGQAVDCGPEPHEHHGVSCVAILTAELEEQDANTSLHPITTAAISVQKRTFPASAAWLTPNALRPPTTGPPAI